MANNIEHTGLMDRGEERRYKLDNIQQLLFHNKLQKDKKMPDSEYMVREPRVPPNLM